MIKLLTKLMMTTTRMMIMLLLSYVITYGHLSSHRLKAYS